MNDGWTADSLAVAKALVQAMDAPAALCAPDGVVLHLSEPARRWFDPQVSGALLVDFLADSSRAVWSRLRAAAAAGERGQAALTLGERSRAEGHPLDVTVRPISGVSGQVLGFTAAFSEPQPSTSPESTTGMLRRALDAIAEGVVVADLDQRAIYTNRAFTELAGGEAGRQLAVGNVIGSGRESADLRQSIRRHLDAGQSFRGEIDGSDDAGRRFWHEIVVTPLRNDAGEVTHFVGVREDITRRKLIEQSLEESRSRLQALFTTAMDGIISFDKDHRIALINHAAQAMFGLTESGALGRSIDELIPSVLASGQLESLRTVDGVAESSPVVGRLGELQGRRADGEEFPLEVSLSQVQVNGRQMFTAILRDISARREAERVLQASQRRFKSIFEHSIDGIMLLDDAGRYLDANPAACRLLGYSHAELVGLEIRDLVNAGEGPAIAQRWEEFLRQGSAGGEVSMRRKDGNSVQVEYSAIAHILDGLHLSIMRDVTERQALQEQLLRQQRLDSIGRLASGLAHDLNNILTPILMVPGMLRGRVQDATSLNLLDLLEQGARRGAAIIEQLLTFARERPGERKLQQVGTLVETAARLMRETFPKNVQLEVRVDAHAWPCLGDATQLQQLVLNLAINAKDAMPAGGRLTLGVANEHVSAETARNTPGAKPGPYVVVSVVDTGRGIDPQHVGRIFDPFFTTKSIGEGAGLGLSSALGIARNHGGFIAVRSTPKQGATFRVFLPAVGVEPAVVRPPVPELAPRGEVVLVVDDEEDLRSVARQLLSHHGYQVICAKDGEAALAQLKAVSHRVDLVLTDLAMPGMGGARLVALLRRRNPDLRIIVMSGRDPERSGQDEGPPAHGFLRKPFTGEELLKALQTAGRTGSS